MGLVWRVLFLCGLCGVSAPLGGCLDEKVLDGEYGRDGATAPAEDLLPVATGDPVVKIASPRDGEQRAMLLPIAFAGSATDEGGGQLTGMALQWKSSIDGSIGSGVAFSRTLSPGEHTITLTATDARNRMEEASISLSVR